MKRSDTSPLTHLDPAGGVRMVDVGGKEVTEREAVAVGSVRMKPETLDLIAKGAVPKGDVLTTAQVAGIMAAKKTPDLIPLCHSLDLAGVSVHLSLDTEGNAVNVRSAVRLSSRTGAEMEALTAVSVACLTVYDMCKAVDRDMEITYIRLIRKSGGKSGLYIREGEKDG
ncbi:MAG: cyclic pyranopterin monophosphate synthase MoaC [Bacillota bacterium]